MSILDDLTKGKKKDLNLGPRTGSLSTLERITRKDVKEIIEKTPSRTERAKSLLGKAASFVSKVNLKATRALSFGRPTTIGEALEKKEELPTFQRSFVAGVGDILHIAGATATWLGKEGLGTKLMKEGAQYRSIGVEDVKTPAEFEWKDMYDPSFYVTTVARSIPFTLALIPTAIVGAYAGAATAGAIGLGAFGTLVLASIGAASLSRPLESALEAGGVYDEQIAKGKSKEEADAAADKTFKGNLSLVGMDATEFVLAFAPTPKGSKPWVRALLKTAGITGNFLMEGSEEVIQGAIGKAAQDEKIDIFSKESQQEFAIGGIMGAGHGVAGGIFNTLKGTVAESYQEEYQKEFTKNVNKGETPEVAEMKALDTVAERHPKQVEKLVEDTVKNLSGISDEQVVAIEAEERKEEPVKPVEKPTKPPVKKPPVKKPKATKGELTQKQFDDIMIEVAESFGQGDIIGTPRQLKNWTTTRIASGDPAVIKRVNKLTEEVLQATEAVKSPTKKLPAIPKELEPLAKEARKYKSAEEFNKAMGKLTGIEINKKFGLEGTFGTKSLKDFGGKDATLDDMFKDFYTQATKEVKPSVKKPIAKEAKIETKLRKEDRVLEIEVDGKLTGSFIFEDDKRLGLVNPEFRYIKEGKRLSEVFIGATPESIKKDIRGILERTDLIEKVQEEKFVPPLEKKVKPKKKEKVVRVPETQLPVGEGKEKVSRLQARLKGALTAATQEDIEELGLTTFRQMNQDAQIAKASEYVTNNTEDAIRVVFGEIDPPKGMLQNSILVALIELGKTDTDVAVKVATLTATRFGQEINILKKIMADNPVVMMQDIVNVRIEAFEKRTGKTVTQRVKTETNRITGKAKSTTKEQWSLFIESIRC